MKKYSLMVTLALFIADTQATCWDGRVIGYIQNDNGKLSKQMISGAVCGSVGSGSGQIYGFKDGTTIDHWHKGELGGEDRPLSINKKRPIIIPTLKGVPKNFNCYKNPSAQNKVYCVPDLG